MKSNEQILKPFYKELANSNNKNELNFDYVDRSLTNVMIKGLNPDEPYLNISDKIKSNKDYIDKELYWYKSGSYDSSYIQQHAKLWKSITSKFNHINSNYGAIVYGGDTPMINNAIMALTINPLSRQSIIQYAGRDIYTLAYTNACKDFICTDYVKLSLQPTSKADSSDYSIEPIENIQNCYIKNFIKQDFDIYKYMAIFANWGFNKTKEAREILDNVIIDSKELQFFTPEQERELIRIYISGNTDVKKLHLFNNIEYFYINNFCKFIKESVSIKDLTYAKFSLKNYKLTYTIHQRSCDAIFGFLNDFAWHCFVYKDIQSKIDCESGQIDYIIDDFHYYDRHSSKMDSIKDIK